MAASSAIALGCSVGGTHIGSGLSECSLYVLLSYRGYSSWNFLTSVPKSNACAARFDFNAKTFNRSSDREFQLLLRKSSWPECSRPLMDFARGATGSWANVASPNAHRTGGGGKLQHTSIATMDADLTRGSARCQCFNVPVRRECSLGTSQTLSDKISEHPEFGAARGRRPPGQDQGAERLVWRE